MPAIRGNGSCRRKRPVPGFTTRGDGTVRLIREIPVHRLRRRAESPPPVRACPNCGTPVDDRYCPRCGQKNEERLVSVRAIVADAVEDQFSVGSTLPRTLGGLLFHPGFLTREYVAGRIARYIPPLKLYLAASVLFFVAASFVAGFDVLWGKMAPMLSEMTGQPPAALGAPLPGANYALVHLEVDSAAVPGWLRPPVRYYLRREDQLNAMAPREGVRVLYEAVAQNVPRVMFLLVPLFALFLKGLYRRRLYVEHFVFVLHLHAFAFLLATVALLALHLWVAALLAAWLLGYLFVALRRFYDGTVVGTVARYLALLVGYQVVMIVSSLAVMLASVLTA